jgi:eukaryotic-like serine/threonine-protein kinase
MNDRWERLIDLYHTAVMLPADERATLLSEECGDDSILRADVERMIVAHHRVSRPTGAAPVVNAAPPPPPAPPQAVMTAVERVAEPQHDDVRRYVDAPVTPKRRAKRRPRPTGSPRRRGGAIVAWTLAAAAVGALGVEVRELVGRRAAASPAPPAISPVDVPATRTRLFVADLEGASEGAADPQMALALSDAFRTGLAESPSAAVLATRAPGADAEMTGSIARAADGRYTITAQLTRANVDGPVTLHETAVDSTDVVQALSRLSVRMREQLGESQTSIAVTPRLEDVSSPSLPALRAFTNGSRAIHAGDRAGGIRWLRAAVALDTGFASAHRLLGVTYRDASDRTHAREALDHSIANQMRLPFYERNQTIASYALSVNGGYATAIDAYNRILARDPRDARVLASLGTVHAARREYAVQESLLVRAIAVDPGVPSLHTELVLAAVNQGKYGAARRLLDRAGQKFPGLRDTHLASIALAASRQDWESAEREAREMLARVSADSVDALDELATLGAILMTQGRLADAQQQLRRAVTLGTRQRAGRQTYAATLALSYLELRYRQSSSGALSTMNGTLTRLPLGRMEPDARPYDAVARLFADAGQPARARDLMAQAALARDHRGSNANLRWTAGAVAMAERRAWEGEIEIRGAAETHPCPICALPDLARAYEVSGKPDSAIATYERYLRAPWQRRFETDAVELGFAMKRLGELYQQQNDDAKAAEQYTALLQLWRAADAELGPLLADVRRRLDQTAPRAPSP